ncbi:sodium-dependent transporter [bacterium]|nr:sodium-dependent transporter [bacterium]
MAEARDRWHNRTGFILAAVGSAVGLGNVWRFPYICYRNGGGAFLIPYFVALLTAGIPLLILEFALGHKMQAGAPKSFQQVSEKTAWVGWWAVFVGFSIVVYYAVIMAWCFGYLVYSLNLAWGTNAESFFMDSFLMRSSGPGLLGSIRWPVLAGLAATWLSILLIISKGVKSVGKVVLVTVPLPMLLLIIMVIRGVTLPGAAEGLRYYLTPNFEVLTDPSVWLAAYGQIFFTLSIGFGVMIAYASYLPKKADIANNAFIIGLVNCGTSFLAGFAVFGTLGYLAHTMGTGVDNVVSGGLELAFITYPTMIRLLPFGASIFGVIFFLMLLTLGIDSAFSLVEAAVAGGMDRWKVSRKTVNLITCSLAFCGGLIFCTRAGLHWLDIVDHFLNNFGLALVGLAECLVIGYVFGTKRMREYINSVSEIKIGVWWDWLVKLVTPLILAITVIMSIVERLRVPYGNYPQWALVIGGWGVALLVLALALLANRRWLPLAILLSVAALIGLGYLTSGAVAMAVFGCVALYGGLLLCLRRALKKKAEVEEGWGE